MKEEYALAVKCLLRCSELDGSSHFCFHNLGVAYLCWEKYDMAVQAFEKVYDFRLYIYPLCTQAIDLEEDDINSNLGLLHAQLRVGNDLKSIDTCRK